MLRRMYDQCCVDISTDGGYNWDRIRENIPGSSSGWITTSLDISGYWNQTVKIRFFFFTDDEMANNFPGWFIDDVKIYVDDFGFPFTISRRRLDQRRRRI